jgi:hypothetical protein
MGLLRIIKFYREIARDAPSAPGRNGPSREPDTIAGDELRDLIFVTGLLTLLGVDDRGDGPLCGGVKLANRRIAELLAGLGEESRVEVPAWLSREQVEEISQIFASERPNLTVESLCYIYEGMLGAAKTKKEGIFYTPVRTVKLVLDLAFGDCDTAGRPKLLDPACGSGIFLVTAFRRLLLAGEKAGSFRLGV